MIKLFFLFQHDLLSDLNITWNLAGEQLNTEKRSMLISTRVKHNLEIQRIQINLFVLTLSSWPTQHIRKFNNTCPEEYLS